MTELEQELELITRQLLLKEIDDTLSSLRNRTLVETGPMIDRLLDMRRLLV